MADVTVTIPTPETQTKIFDLTHAALKAVTDAYNLGFFAGREVERKANDQKKDDAK